MRHPPSARSIYTAEIQLRVKDFAETEQEITQLVDWVDGYVAEFREDRRYGQQLAGRWVVRIPVKSFEEFTEKVLSFGVPLMRQVDAEDVTEQYVDLTARLSNKRKLEERILNLLEEQAGEIKDVIAVETELGRVREEIEVLEGKLRYLTDRVTMTTVTINVQEDRDYVPPQAPSFVTRVSEVFFGSLETLRQAAEMLALALVALLPWLLIALTFLSSIVVLLRRWRRRRQRRQAADAQVVD